MAATLPRLRRGAQCFFRPERGNSLAESALARCSVVPVKTWISGGSIVTNDDHDSVLEADLLLGDGGRIEAVVPRGGEIPAGGVVRVVDASGCAVIPGFVQAHVHLCQVLFRGMADDLPLLDWLKERIWPFEAAHTPVSLAASAELGLLEMMRAGTTTILDMGTVRHHDEVFAAMERAKMRGFSGKTMMDAGADVPAGLRESTDESLAESDALYKRWHGGAGGLLGYAYAPRFILSCTERLFRGVAERAKENGALLHSHAAEHPGEREAVRGILGRDDVDALQEWGFWGKNVLLAHGVQLDDAQADAAAAAGTRFVHCPSANLKLGSGIARVHELLARGVPMALGADGAPCNNNLDPFVELRHAALLAKVRSGTTTLPAKQAFRLATIDGARALGLDDKIGKIAPNYEADLAIVRLDAPHIEPGGDVHSRLVYAATARDVTHVFVRGEEVVRHGEHLRLDQERVLARAREEAKQLAARAL
jgi:5-methylthioadenosine/S-adenosylhomocysteine deaminase